MKTFRMIGMVLVAFLLSVNWVSCSGGDEPDSNEELPVTEEKKLVTVLTKRSENDTYCTRMIYNDEGRLMTTEIERGQTSNWFWTENNVSNNKSVGVDFSLENGLIKEFRDYGDLVYNASNQFIKINKGEYGKRDLTWKDGAVIKQIIDYGDPAYGVEQRYEMNYSYKKTCKGYFPLFFFVSLKYSFPSYSDYFTWVGEETALLYAHPELVGLRINQLPDKVIMQGFGEYSDNITEYSFAYSFTSDGYIEKCTVVIKEKIGEYNHEYTEVYSFTFEWE